MTSLKCEKTVNYASNEKLNYTFLRGQSRFHQSCHISA